MPTRSATATRRSTRKSASKALKAVPPPDQVIDNFDLTSALDGMTDNHLLCRELRHAWRPLTVDNDRKARCYELRLRCTKCKTVRVRGIGYDGGLLYNRYEYPDGYLVRGMGRLDDGGRAQVRLASVMRLIDAGTARAAG